MVMAEDVKPAQAEVTSAETQPGTTEPQVVEPSTEVRSDQATEPQKERVYSAKEWQEREAARDREIAGHRQVIAQLALRQQIAQTQAQENQAAAKDNAAVERGEITEQDAQQRQQQRAETLQFQEQQHQAREVTQRVLVQGEAVGRILAANDLAKEYGVDAAVLVADKAITNYDQMEAKAAKLALRKAKTSGETFDSGHVGGASGASIDAMTPEQKIAYGLKQRR